MGAHVRIGQPRVEGEDRHLDAEAGEHPTEDQELRAESDVAGGDPFGETADREGLAPVRKNTARKLTIISAEPNNVNRKNLMAAHKAARRPTRRS